MSNRYVVAHIDSSQFSFMQKMVAEKKGFAKLAVLIHGELSERKLMLSQVSITQYKELKKLIADGVCSAWIDYEANVEGLENPAWVASAGRDGGAMKALAADWFADMLVNSARQ